MGVISGRLSEGSSSFEIGNTRVLATVFGPREVSTSGVGGGDSGINMATALPIGDATVDEHDGKINVRMHAASFSSTGGERRKNTRQDR